MVEVSSPLTLKIAIAFGVYMLVGGATGFHARNRWYAMLDSYEGAPGLAFVTGAFVFVLGSAIIISHNIWTDILSGFISLVGWAAAIEGLVLIAAPVMLIKFCKSIMHPALISGFAACTVAGGGALVYTGLTGQVAS